MERRTALEVSAHKHLTHAEMEVVHAIHMFDGLEPKIVDRLVDEASAEFYPKDAFLFSAGDPADRFFIIVSGRVRLFALTPMGKHTTISFIEAGQSFAEAAIFGMRVFPVNADVAGGTRLVHVPAGPFLARLSADPELPLRMLGALARWQSRLIETITELKAFSPSQRFAAVLLSLTDQASGPAVVPLPISKSALANRIGIAPESLSRVFTRMHDLGVVVDGAVVRIGDVYTLRVHCHQTTDEPAA